MDRLIQQTLGQYRIIERIRQGGMAVVYKAYQESLDRYVAIKVLSHNSDPQFAVRFKREARAIAQLQHPNILPIYDSNEQDGLLYLVMQYVENGTTLGDMLGVPMEQARALRLISKVLDALGYAHNYGIIHRDIKPANVLLPTPDWPMLADFGIAKLRGDDQKLTLPGLIIGTAAYMAPEQVTGQAVDARSDLYATGVMLYELVTGRVPFDADTPMALLAKHAYEPPPPPRSVEPSVTPAVEALLLRALAKDPAGRFQSAAAMAEACLWAADRLGPSKPAVAARYQEGVRALNEGRFDLATARFQEVQALDPNYSDSAALLAAARDAQRGQPGSQPQGTQPTPAQPQGTQPAPAQPQGTQPTPAQPQFVFDSGQLARPGAPAERPSGQLQPGAAPEQPAQPPATPAPAAAPAGAGSRLRVPLIIGGVLVLLVLAGVLILPGLRSGTPSGGAATSAPQPTAANAPQPTAANAPQPTAALPALPAPAGTLSLEDDFGAGGDKSGLVGQIAPDLALAIADPGVYSMKLSQPNQTRWAFSPRLLAGDFSLQIDLSDASADRTGAAAGGVVFRARDASHFYALLIDARSGTYTLRKQDGANKWSDLIAAKESPLVRKGGDVNQLRIDASGNTFTLFLNGAQLDSASDGAYASGMLGTLVANAEAGTSEMRFDNLKIWSADKAPQFSNRPATQQSFSGEMVLIHGGDFIMGSNANPADLPHVVQIDDFYIDRNEVTNQAFVTCVDQRGCELLNFKSATHPDYASNGQFSFFPVLNVTWQQAKFFCEQSGKRLPSEAEWEKAASWDASARMKMAWPWGNSWDPSRLNSADAKRDDTVAVGTFRDDINGTRDMAGNAAEWTSTLKTPYPYDPADGREDPNAPGPRVVRGGSWAQTQAEVSPAARQAFPANTSSDQIGFRCASPAQ
ncbi:protein kinase domain-containing protein [Kouleothrix sp.]|uniref:bifunctional serine/threonine-protein kinase/formylglycine-generating enzyme family protein n=1 Tax=Kouleothrix sp. TaxID=2779161 RepID=UPI003918BFDB